MFICEYSGEQSDGAKHRIVEKIDVLTGLTTFKTILVQAAEKPVKVVVQIREKTYSNWLEDSEGEMYQKVTRGTEIVKEILIKRKYLDAISKG